MLVEIYIDTKYITTVDWSQVPDEGERLVIDGIDYKIHSRKWCIYNSSLPQLSSNVQIILKEI